MRIVIALLLLCSCNNGDSKTVIQQIEKTTPSVIGEAKLGETVLE